MYLTERVRSIASGQEPRSNRRNFLKHRKELQRSVE